MGDFERQPVFKDQPEHEYLDPRHFYAAYVFDQAEERGSDVQSVIELAHELGYPVRYWWLSEAMDLQGSPDRLIVCVHHPSSSEDAGMDLYNALTEKKAAWDELDSAALEEYIFFGKPASHLADLRSMSGAVLFPDANPGPWFNPQSM